MLFLLNCAETAMQMASEKPFNSNWIIIHNDSTHKNTIWYVQSFWPSFVVRLGAAALHPNRIVTVIVEKCCSKNTAKFYESFIALHTRYVEFINTLDSEAHTACSMHGDADGLLLYGNQFVSLAEAQLSVKFIYYILNKFFNASTLFSSAQAVHVHRQTPATIKYFVLRCLVSRNEKIVFSENNYRPVFVNKVEFHLIYLYLMRTVDVKLRCVLCTIYFIIWISIARLLWFNVIKFRDFFSPRLKHVDRF